MRDRDNAIMRVVILGFGVLQHTTQGMAIKRQHCRDNEKDKLQQQSTVNAEPPKSIIYYY